MEIIEEALNAAFEVGIPAELIVRVSENGIYFASITDIGRPPGEGFSINDALSNLSKRLRGARNGP